MRIRLQHPVTAIAGTLSPGPGPSFASRAGRQMCQETFKRRRPQSASPTDWEIIFARINQRRRLLTPAQIAGWKSFAGVLERERLGATYVMPWWSAYLAVNSLTLTLNDAFQDVAPAQRPTLQILAVTSLFYTRSAETLNVTLTHNGIDPSPQYVKIACWQGSSSAQRSAIRSELRWVSGPTPDSIRITPPSGIGITIHNPVFTWPETVHQTLELTPISPDFFPGRTMRFHKTQPSIP